MSRNYENNTERVVIDWCKSPSEDIWESLWKI